MAEMKSGKRWFLFIFGLLYLIFFSSGVKTTRAEAEHLPRFLDITGFTSSPELFFDNWQVQTVASVPAQTQYRLVSDEFQGRVIQASARTSFAGLTRRLEIDPLLYPYISWSWKVSGTLNMADLTKKEGDDSPARLMVSFGRNYRKGGRPAGTLCYVWATGEATESLHENPYSPEIMVIVVASGEQDVGTWQQYRRNFVDDYHRAFGEPPGKIRGVTLITDTDNTGGQVDAWYGSIRFERKSTAP